jgi:methanethiol S-methyltransferase
MSEAPAYGLWSLVIVNSLVFIVFAFSFARPRTGRDWRAFGGFAAFVVALFTEMYGLDGLRRNTRGPGAPLAGT